MSPPPASPRKQLGAWAERLAATHLEVKGYRLLARNWRCAAGEIDLIAQDGSQIVFVEVKARRGRTMGTPEMALTVAKQRRLLDLAARYLLAHDLETDDWRVDLLAVELDGQGRLLRCTHWPGVAGEWLP